MRCKGHWGTDFAEYYPCSRRTCVSPMLMDDGPVVLFFSWVSYIWRWIWFVHD